MAGVDDKKRRTVAACAGVWGAAGGGRRTLFWLRKKPLGSAISPGEKALTVTVFS